MKTITEYFERIIEVQNRLGYLLPKILRPPLDEQSIKQTETTLGFKFSSELKELYSFANGTDYLNYPSGKTGLIPIHTFLSIEDAILNYTISIQVEDFFLNYDTNFKPNKCLFPFLSDGAGDFYWIDLNLNTENYAKIYWTSSSGEEPCYVYKSLTTLFKIVCECYESGIIYTDSEGYLDCNYEAFKEISKTK